MGEKKKQTNENKQFNQKSIRGGKTKPPAWPPPSGRKSKGDNTDSALRNNCSKEKKEKNVKETKKTKQNKI